MPIKTKPGNWIPFGIFILCIFLTILFTLKATRVENKQYSDEVEHEVNNTVNSVSERLIYYEELLESFYPLFLITDSVDIEQWSEFIKNSIVKDFRSSIREIGVILYTPEKSSKIKFLERYNENDEISYKEHSDNQSINKAMKMAMESRRVSFAWENIEDSADKENINSSIFLFYPFFTIRKTAPAGETELTFNGWGFLSFRIEDIVEPYIDRIQYTDLTIRINKIGGEISDSLLYRKTKPLAINTPSVVKEISVPLNLADMNLIFQFKNLQNTSLTFFFKPPYVLITGFLISIIISLLYYLLHKTRNEAEQESAYLSTRLSENEKLRDIIFDTANAGIIFLDEDKRILLTNKWWANKTGYSAEELSGKQNAEITFPEDRENTASLIDDLLSEKNQTRETKIRYLRKDNSFFWGDLSLSVARVPDNGKMMIVGVVIDISEHIQAKETINYKNAELSRIVEERNRFISTLAHDLRTPFNTILGFTDILVENLKYGEYEKIKKNISVLNYSINNTYDLLMDIISWARLQTGKMSFNPKTINLYTLCSETIKIFSPFAASKKISIVLSVTPEKLVTGDADMIKSVIRNLLSNALKFTNSEGSITISSSDPGLMGKDVPATLKKVLSGNSTVEIISISDTGIGIEPEKLIKLFDRTADFTQKGTEDGKGTGIGLVLCREYINMHGGIIWAESTPGKGSTFYFTLQRMSA